MTSATVTTPKQDRRPAVIAAIGTVCALTLGVGLGLWQSNSASSGTAPSVRPAPAVVVHPGNRPDIDIPADGVTSGMVALPAPHSRIASTLYIVATSEAAASLRAGLSSDAAGRVAIAAPGSSEEARLLATISNADAASAELGLPAVQVVDLRNG